MSNGNHPINGLMDSSLQNLRSLVDADTVIGEAITTPDGTVIIPVSKVSYGFASGGSDFVSKNAASKDLFGGGAGGGVSVQPLAFLVIKDGHVELLQINDNKNTADRVVAMVPDVVDKISGLFSKKDKKKKEQPEEKPAKSSIDDIDLSDPLV